MHGGAGAGKAYLIQADEEQEVSDDLLQQLAAVLAESPELTFADATYRVHSSHGILAIEGKEEAARISQRFNDLGFRNFVVQELLTPPRPQHLNLETPELDEEVGLAVAARLHFVTERTVREFNVRRFSLSLAITGIPRPRAAIEKRTIEQSDTRFYLDLFTQTKHWRAQVGSPLPIQALLGKAQMPKAHLSKGVQILMQGEHHIPTFQREDDYDKYITWLYQLRFAER
jgi:hypothetical protein